MGRRNSGQVKEIVKTNPVTLKSSTMKKGTLIFSLIAITALNSCNQETDVKTILEDSETRTELFDAIAGNHSYMTQFMDKMQDNDHAIQMMQGSHKMMGNMMQGGGIQMVMKDSTMMKNMEF